MLPAQPNQSLVDGLAVLQALATAKEPVGSREMARELALEPTRVNRLLKTLSYLGMARQDEKRQYVPGPAIHVLAAQALFGSGLLRRALPHLQILHRHGLVVALGVLWRDQVSYLYHATPGMPAGEALGRAGLYPAADSGIGHALLARLDDQTLHQRLGDHPAFESLLNQIRITRRRGYAHVRRRDEGAQTLSVALADDTQAAIALAGQIEPQRIDLLVRALRQAAQSITDAGVGPEEDCP